MADQLVVIGRGRLIASGPIEDFVRTSTRNAVVVRSPRGRRARRRAAARGRHRRAVTEPGRSRSPGLDAQPGRRPGLRRRRSGCTSFATGWRRWRRRSWRRPGARRSSRSCTHAPSPRRHQRRHVGRGVLVRGLGDALRYEWVRITSIRSTSWLPRSPLVFAMGLSFLVAIGFTLGLALGQPALGRGHADGRTGAGQPVRRRSGCPTSSAYILAMISVFAWGHEYRHGMVRATLTALSSRTATWVAKFARRRRVGALVTVLAIGCSRCSAGWLWLRGDGVERGHRRRPGRPPAAPCSTRCCFTWLARRVHRAGRATRPPRWCCCSCGRWRRERHHGGVHAGAGAARPRAAVTRFLPFNAAARILNQIPEADGVFGDPLSLVGGPLIFGVLDRWPRWPPAWRCSTAGTPEAVARSSERRLPRPVVRRGAARGLRRGRHGRRGRRAPGRGARAAARAPHSGAAASASRWTVSGSARRRCRRSTRPPAT